MKRSISSFGDEVIQLRLAEERDLADMLIWRNRDDVRIWFKTSGPIAPESHQGWFSSYLCKEDDYLFIIESGGRKVGQCAVYRIDCVTRSAEVGRFLAAPGESGKGYMRRACTLLTRFAMRELDLRYLYLEVFENNTRALQVYRDCGFVEEAREQALIRMGLTSEVSA